LEQALRALYRPRKKAETGEEVLAERVDDSFDPQFKMAWGPGAEAASFDFEESMASDPDPMRQAVFGRANEKACKAASIVVFMDGRTVVELADFNWAKAWVLLCDETLLEGVKKYSSDPQGFADTGRNILDFVKNAQDEEMSMRDLKRKCFSLIKNGKDVDGALQYLAECECIKLVSPPPGKPGRRSIMVKWLANLTD
jgi:hypothetical protein